MLFGYAPSIGEDIFFSKKADVVSEATGGMWYKNYCSEQWNDDWGQECSHASDDSYREQEDTSDDSDSDILLSVQTTLKMRRTG